MILKENNKNLDFLLFKKVGIKEWGNNCFLIPQLPQISLEINILGGDLQVLA